MSAGDLRREQALASLKAVALADNSTDVSATAGMGAAFALLAIEARLGEMVHAQETANLIGALAVGAFPDGIDEGLRKAIRGRITDIIQRGSMARANGNEGS